MKLGSSLNGCNSSASMCSSSLICQQGFPLRVTRNRLTRSTRIRHSIGPVKCAFHPDATEEFDVVVIGAGICGSTFARKLVPAGLDVLLVDAGAQNGKKPGW